MSEIVKSIYFYSFHLDVTRYFQSAYPAPVPIPNLPRFSSETWVLYTSHIYLLTSQIQTNKQTPPI